MLITVNEGSKKVKFKSGVVVELLPEKAIKINTIL